MQKCVYGFSITSGLDANVSRHQSGRDFLKRETRASALLVFGNKGAQQICIYLVRQPRYCESWLFVTDCAVAYCRVSVVHLSLAVALFVYLWQQHVTNRRVIGETHAAPWIDRDLSMRSRALLCARRGAALPKININLCTHAAAAETKAPAQNSRCGSRRAATWRFVASLTVAALAFWTRIRVRSTEKPHNRYQTRSR